MKERLFEVVFVRVKWCIARNLYAFDPDAIRIVDILPQKVGVWVDGDILTILPEGQQVDVEVSSILHCW